MKHIFALTLICSWLTTQAQYFQNLHNYDYVNGLYRNEHFGSGIRTRENLNANGSPNSYSWTGIGTSFNNAAVATNNLGDEVRFIRTVKQGTSTPNNLGYLFRDSPAGSPFYNSSGNSIAEIKTSTFNGGYIGVGAVANNTVTGAVAPGGSDGLFINFSSTGAVVNASRYDWNGGYDIAWCVRESRFMPLTWLICGETQKAGYTDVWLARVNNVGGIIWAFEFGFDATVTGNTPSSFCKAYQLCEDASGNVYVVGTYQDAGSPDIDGLAFATNSLGGLLWVNRYTVFGAITDDEFQADRLDFDGNIIVGGFSTAVPTGVVNPNMWIVKLNAAAGAIMFQNLLQVVDANGKYPSKCYDIIPRINTVGTEEYYLVGPVYRPAGINTCVYKTNAGGLGINSYSYSTMKYDVGFAIDQVENAVNLPGLGVFSSSTILGTGFSDSYLLKTYYNGATCTNFCPADPPVNFFQNFGFQPPQKFLFTPIKVTPLKSKKYKFQVKFFCNQNPVPCGNNARTNHDFVSGIGGFELYPNPAQDQLTLHLGEAAAAEINVVIYDATGRAVLLQKISAGNISLNISIATLPKGYYVIKVGEGVESLRKSFIKE